MRLFNFTVLFFVVSAIYASQVAISRRQNARALSAKRRSIPSPTLVNRAGHSNDAREHYHVVVTANSIKSLLNDEKKPIQVAGGSHDPVFRPRLKFRGTTSVIVIVVNMYTINRMATSDMITYFDRVYGWVAWGLEDPVYYIAIKDCDYLSEAQVTAKHPDVNLQKAREDTRDAYYNKHNINIGTHPQDFLYKFFPPLSYQAIRV